MLVRSPRSVKGVDLRACLQLPAFSSATVRTWPERTDELVTWVVTIEWPIEDFVSPHDMVLTTGLGCDTGQLGEMITLIAASGAAAICISTGVGAIHTELDPAVVESAVAGGIVLVEIPWRVHFADLSRAVVGALYDEEPPAEGGLPAAFTSPLLSASGVTGIADALEQTAGAPAIIFDATMAARGAGSRGAEWLAPPAAGAALVEAMSRHASCVEQADSGSISTVDLHDLGAAVVCPVRTPRDLLGWLAVVVPDGTDVDAIAPALSYAATAAAIEFLRSAAGSDLEARGRAQFLWDVASGLVDSTQELAARAALLGLGLSMEYLVGVGRLESSGNAHTPEAMTIHDAAARIQRDLTHQASVVAPTADQECLILLCGPHDVSAVLSGRLDRVLTEAGLTLGFAAGRHNLGSLPIAVGQARTVCSVTRSLHGPGTIGRGEQFQAHLMVSACLSDTAALRHADEILGPLERADAARRSELVRTLRAFLDANGNIASAARALYLNRHSLTYRLRRISELSGVDLGDPDDRLALSIALRIRELQNAAHDPLAASTAAAATGSCAARKVAT